MNTILITVDALRADHLSQYGYHRNTMPVLDRLTESGSVFSNAFSNAPYTRVSIPSFQTSRYLAYDNLDSYPSIGAIMSENNIHTAAIGTQTGINLVEGDFNYDEYIDLGRDDFKEKSDDDSFTNSAIIGINGLAVRAAAIIRNNGGQKLVDMFKNPYQKLVPSPSFEFGGYIPAEEVTDEVIKWLSGHSKEDFFFWIHYMEAHRPFGIHDTNPEYLDEKLSEEEIKELIRKVHTNPGEVTEAEHQKIHRPL